MESFQEYPHGGQHDPEMKKALTPRLPPIFHSRVLKGVRRQRWRRRPCPNETLLEAAWAWQVTEEALFTVGAFTLPRSPGMMSGLGAQSRGCAVTRMRAWGSSDHWLL